MDGNRRWAQKRGMPRELGHKEGANAFRRVVKECKRIGIPYVSFFAFSTENWQRPKNEIEAILSLLDDYIQEVRRHASENVKIIFLGDKSPFSPQLRGKLLALEEDTSKATGMTLLIALNYGGRDDIIQGAKRAAQLVKEGVWQPEDISAETLGQLLYTSGIPDLDLVIRPSGEQRISNFMLWQAAYAELYFTNTLWPDFNETELARALDFFYSRQRRFGGI